MKYYVYALLLVLVLLVGCATTPEAKPPESIPAEPTQEPTQPVEQPSETAPTETSTPELVKIPNDIKEILEKGKTKLTSYSYNYKSPESDEAYEIYIKESKIKVVPSEIVNVEGEKFYNVIYLDTQEKTAEAYCEGYSNCGVNLGKIKDLNYDDAYIETPLDWLEKVTEATEIDQRTVEGRSSLYLETNIGKITVESYYGFLYKIEQGSQKWEFTDAAFNSVKDSDVTP